MTCHKTKTILLLYYKGLSQSCITNVAFGRLTLFSFFILEPLPPGRFYLEKFILRIALSKYCHFPLMFSFTITWPLTMCLLYPLISMGFVCKWFNLFNDISTTYGLFNAKNWLICKCLSIIMATFSMFQLHFFLLNWPFLFVYNHLLTHS